MSELVTGPQVPEGWSKASNIWFNGRYIPGGWIWIGDEQSTTEDYARLLNYLPEGYEIDIDKGTLCGLLHKDWVSRKDKIDNTKRWNRQGGWGSRYYMHQGTAAGVEFAEYDIEANVQAEIWHYNKEGNFVREVPGKCGEHHWQEDGDTYYSAYEGPEWGSPAEKQLGDGEYYLDMDLGYWKVRGVGDVQP